MYKYVANGLNGNVGTLLQNYINFKEKGDVFIHLAAKSDGIYNEMIDSNINYLIQTIKKCEQMQIKNFIFFSAISIYNKDDLYSHTKRIGEIILKETDFNVLILRLPMILTNDKKNGVLNRIRQKLEKNEDIELYNWNKKFNNFITVQEIANFIKDYKFNKKYEIINLATDLNKTILEIVEFLRILLNSNSKIIKMNRTDDFFNIDISKAKEYGFIPLDTRNKLKDWCEANNFK